MAFEYGCFVSYVHPDGSMMKTFIADLVLALESELDPYMDEQVFFDEDRLKPGYRYDLALGRSLCASACWIVVYVPQYRKSDYCLREYHTMTMLEGRRRKQLGHRLPAHRSMIVPILVRGMADELPGNLSGTQCLTFDYVTLAESTISDRPEAMAQIRDLAGEISEIHKLGDELEADCDGFEMPELNGDLGFKPVEQPFPGDRGAGANGGGP